MKFSVLTVWGLLAVAGLLGCSKSSPRAPLGKVEGTVNYKGRPLLQGAIVFHNVQGRSANGLIDNGEILDVTTYDVPNDGAPIGTLTVTIHAKPERRTIDPSMPADATAPPPKSAIPSRYSDPKLSGLTAVIESGVNQLTFELND